MESVESSALNSHNVETAFYKLISTIYAKVEQGYFNDRLEQFNYFGSAFVRQKAIEEAEEAMNGDYDGRGAH